MSPSKGEPALHMISDIILEDLGADNVFAVAIVRKSQNCSSSLASIGGRSETTTRDASIADI